MYFSYATGSTSGFVGRRGRGPSAPWISFAIEDDTSRYSENTFATSASYEPDQRPSSVLPSTRRAWTPTASPARNSDDSTTASTASSRQISFTGIWVPSYWSTDVRASTATSP